MVRLANGERYSLSFVFDRFYTEVRVFLNAVNSRVFCFIFVLMILKIGERNKVATRAFGFTQKTDSLSVWLTVYQYIL